mmetsp:Transcript_24990/g.31206  ORF Transcript_24990/g.31206 Transcript_24990/m.31206 type:complete len:132 (+) Transcript_24990:633-1028(+)|eukprot:CAMPEP_0170473892 /NCGR_PEP_ID=MMETSP0123-20130129/15728_1 /TAXON_ID=182087 /ORGANISM="Favella ehrenbergii, Strain Fehren 1" /LENGTH=131 /DNA_ID=CAMNT_0010743227 /DNA_START=499 /DNA_END=894 /DNA_ORIENTATION=-
MPMILTHVREPSSFSYVSGVDRVFLAPELNLCSCGPKNDVWSIAAILYVMVTGGSQEKRPSENFDFSEAIWLDVSEELKLFLKQALVKDPAERASTNELLSSAFIEEARNFTLQGFILMETRLSGRGHNLF